MLCVQLIPTPATAVIPGTFGAELAKRPSLKDGAGGRGTRDNQFSNSVAMGDRETEDEEEACPVGGTVAELFGESLIPPVQLPLDYSMHVKQRTLPAAASKAIVKQKPRDDNDQEEMDTEESSSSTTKVVKFAKPLEIKGHQVTAAELFTPCEVRKIKNYFRSFFNH